MGAKNIPKQYAKLALSQQSWLSLAWLGIKGLGKSQGRAGQGREWKGRAGQDGRDQHQDIADKLDRPDKAGETNNRTSTQDMAGKTRTGKAIGGAGWNKPCADTQVG